MPTQIIKVDFTTKTVVESECVPKITSWKCDCCGKAYKNIEAAEDNVKHIVLSKPMKNGKDVEFKVCQFCAVQIGDLFRTEGE
jgi:hypothetical protein